MRVTLIIYHVQKWHDWTALKAHQSMSSVTSEQHVIYMVLMCYLNEPFLSPFWIAAFFVVITFV